RRMGSRHRDPAFGALAEYAGTAGVFDRRLCLRAGRSRRDPCRKDPLPVHAGAPPASLVPRPDHLKFKPPPPESTRRTAMINPSSFLRRALIADAIFSGVAALGFTFGAGAFASLFNLPEVFLREVGLFLIAYAAFVGWLGTRQSMMKALALIVIVGNAAWTLGSIALLFSGSVSPNLLGMVMVVAQAIATGVFAELQYIGLRKSGGTVAA